MHQRTAGLFTIICNWSFIKLCALRIYSYAYMHYIKASKRKWQKRLTKQIEKASHSRSSVCLYNCTTAHIVCLLKHIWPSSTGAGSFWQLDSLLLLEVWFLMTRPRVLGELRVLPEKQSITVPLSHDSLHGRGLISKRILR